MKNIRILFEAMVISGAGAAFAQDVKLKVADWLPVSHYTYAEGGKAFMDKATELSKGRIQFQHFPAEQLGKAKDVVTLAQSGVADIVNIAPTDLPPVDVPIKSGSPGSRLLDGFLV